MNEREKEIYEAIMAMEIGRLDLEQYTQNEVDALIYKALKTLYEQDGGGCKNGSR